MAVFLYRIIPPRPDFAETATREEGEMMGQHYLYLKALHEQGVLIFTGRTESGSIGISVFEAKDQAAAQAVSDGDPAKQAGVIDIVVEPFRIVDFAS